MVWNTLSPKEYITPKHTWTSYYEIEKSQCKIFKDSHLHSNKTCLGFFSQHHPSHLTVFPKEVIVFYALWFNTPLLHLTVGSYLTPLQQYSNTWKFKSACNEGWSKCSFLFVGNETYVLKSLYADWKIFRLPSTDIGWWRIWLQMPNKVLWCKKIRITGKQYFAI